MGSPPPPPPKFRSRRWGKTFCRWHLSPSLHAIHPVGLLPLSHRPINPITLSLPPIYLSLLSPLTSPQPKHLEGQSGTAQGFVPHLPHNHRSRGTLFDTSRVTSFISSRGAHIEIEAEAPLPNPRPPSLLTGRKGPRQSPQSQRRKPSPTGEVFIGK